MNSIRMQDKLDEIRSDIGGLQCLRQLLEITANSYDTLSYHQLASLVGTFAASLDWHLEEVQALMDNVK